MSLYLLFTIPPALLYTFPHFSSKCVHLHLSFTQMLLFPLFQQSVNNYSSDLQIKTFFSPKKHWNPTSFPSHWLYFCKLIAAVSLVRLVLFLFSVTNVSCVLVVVKCELGGVGKYTLDRLPTGSDPGPESWRTSRNFLFVQRVLRIYWQREQRENTWDSVWLWCDKGGDVKWSWRDRHEPGHWVLKCHTVHFFCGWTLTSVYE